MNLHDIAKRKDTALVVERGEIAPTHKVGSYFGARVAANSRITLNDLGSYESIREGRDLGWSVVEGEAWFERKGQTVRIESASEAVLKCGEWFQSRSHLKPFLKGEGLEVGPGMNPFAKPEADVHVRYLEDVGKEKWLDRYHRPQSAEADEIWQRYLVGDARYLDGVSDNSLDFIVSSHVFEHLMNPLGVLANWSKRLRRGGSALNVIPDSRYCFDMRQTPSTLAEWRAEQNDATWDPTHAKYEKWCQFTIMRLGAEQSLKDRNYSIHCHYYTSHTFADLAAEAVRQDLFCDFKIFATTNNKDFAVRFIR